MSRRDKDPGTVQESLALAADITQAFASSLEIAETLDNAIRQVVTYLNAEAASIFLLEADNAVLVCRACAGPVQLTGLRISADEGIIGRAIHSNAVQMVHDVRDDAAFNGHVDEETGFTTRSILCAPLRVKDKSLGALEVINKRTVDGLFDADDQHLLSVVAAAASLAIHNAAMAAALVEQERIRRELELARTIQRSLLPSETERRSPIRGFNRPAYEMSGDFYDYFLLAAGRYCFSIADVAGKGMDAALLMAKTSSLFHCLGKTLTDPGRLLAAINGELVEKVSHGMFVTMISGIYDPAADSVRLAVAGHNPPLLLTHGGRFSQLPGAGPPLGVVAGADFPQSERELGGGSLYLYTDGLTEMRRADGQELGVDGLEALILAARKEAPERQLERIVDQALGEQGQPRDDMTMLMIGART